MDPQLTDTIVRLVSGVGFPIVVAGWLLWRMERILTELRDAVLALREEIRASHRP